MSTHQNEHVLRGRFHHYRLGSGLGRRVFRAEDEDGLPWAVKIATKETLLSHLTLASSLPRGVLPKVHELSHLSGGRLTFMVTEYVAGFTLADLLSEGRRLSPAECRKVILDLAPALSALKAQGYIVEEAGPEDVAYDPNADAWRLLSPGRLRQSEDDRPAVRWLSAYLWEASGGGPGERPVWRSQDRRLAGALADGRFGTLSLKALVARLASPFPWRSVVGCLVAGSLGLGLSMLR